MSKRKPQEMTTVEEARARFQAALDELMESRKALYLARMQASTFQQGDRVEARFGALRGIGEGPWHAGKIVDLVPEDHGLSYRVVPLTKATDKVPAWWSGVARNLYENDLRALTPQRLAGLPA